MKTFTKNLVEKGLNPRFKWCGFIFPDQIKCKIEEYLPFCNVILEEFDNENLNVLLDFFDFQIPLKFKLRASTNMYFIQEIIWCL